MAAPVKYRDAANAEYDRHCARQIGILSDGTVIVVTNGDGTTTPQVYVYHSVDRVAFTLKVSPTGGAQGVVLSVAVDAADNIWILTEGNNDQVLWLTKCLKGAGYTWTVPIQEQVTDAGAGSHIRSADLDVTAGGAVGVVWNEDKAGTSPTYKGTIIKVRSTGGAWGAATYIQNTQANWPEFFFSSVFIARDTTPVAGGIEYFFAGGFAYATAGPSTTTWSARVGYTIATGAQSSFTYTGYGFPGVLGSGWNIRYQVFPYANNQWILVAVYQSSGVWYAEVFLVSGTAVTSPWGARRALPTFSNGFYTRAAVAYLSTPAKIAVWTRRSSGGLDCYVLDMTTSTWAGPFRFTADSYTTVVNSLASGAHRNNNLAKADVAMSQEASGDHWFDYNQTPVAPLVSSIIPVNGATVTTDVPQVGVIIPTQQSSEYMTRGRWQIASDAAFTTNVKTITEPFSDLAYGGQVRYETVDNANQLSQGTRYIHAAALGPFDAVSAYSAYNTFTVAHAPTTTNHSPTGNTGLLYTGAGPVTFDWDFADTSPVDNQTAYQVQFEKNDGTPIVDTGKVVSANTFHTLNVAAANKDTILRWRVSVWDSDDVQGPWSAYQLFRIGDAGVVNITAPAEAGVVDNPQPNIVWTFVVGGGRTQKQVRVRVYNTATNVLVYDSGLLTQSTLSHQLNSPVLLNAGAYAVIVDVLDTDGIMGTDTNNFTTAWAAPAAPAYAVNGALLSESGYISVTWNNATQDASWQSWRIYRRIVGATDWTMVDEEILSAANYDFHDWFVKSNTSYEYVVVQVANRFGIPVESVRTGPYGTVATYSDNYWLVHPTDSSFNVKLALVKDESFAEEYEEGVLQLIGRGRKTDYGTRWGFAGSLTAEVWDRTDKTARQLRLDLETLKSQKREVYLRNPFGDIWLVTMGDAQIGRIAGSGIREFHNLTLPYREVV